MLFLTQLFRCIMIKFNPYYDYEYREIERINSNETFVVYISDPED